MRQTKRKPIGFIIAWLTALVFAIPGVNGQNVQPEGPYNKTVFRFIAQDDMFYLAGNEAELQRLFQFVDEHFGEIRSGRTPVYVTSYSTTLSTVRDNRAAAKLMANRVKSELIEKKSLREEDFRTRNIAEDYSGMTSAVVVEITIGAPAPKPEPVPEPEPVVEVVPPAAEPEPIVEVLPPVEPVVEAAPEPAPVVQEAPAPVLKTKREYDPVSQVGPLDMSMMAKSLAVSPDVLLKGRISGVRVSATDGNPVGAMITNIRGANSVRGNSDPLWIVDGVMLNPSHLDVTSMFWKHPESDYTSPQNTLLTINPADIESIQVIKDLSAAAIYGARGANGVVIINTRQATNEDGFKLTWNSNVSFLTPIKNGPDMLGLTDYANFQQQLGNSTSGLDGDVSWQDRMLKNAVAHNHHLSVSGVKEKIRYYVAANIKKMDGVLPGNDSWQGGFRMNFDMRANKLFSFGARMQIAYADLNMSKGTTLLGAPSLTTSVLTTAPALNALYTPDGWKSDYDDHSQEYRMLPTIYFALDFMPGLRLDVNFGVDYRAKDRLMWFGQQTWFGRVSDDNEKGGAASISTMQAFQFNSRMQLSYDGTFAGKHRVTGRAGVEFFGNRHLFNNQHGLGYDIHDLRAKGVFGSSGKPYPHNYEMVYNQFGFFAGAGYEYGGIIGFDVMARMDRTKKYEDDFKIYPAVNVKWNIRNTFMPESGVFSDLSLRGGWGKAARETAAPFDFYTSYYNGTVMEQPESEAVHPFFDTFVRTTSEEFNAALDFGFLGNRILFSAGYYSKKTTDRFSIYKFGTNKISEYLYSRYWFYTDGSLWHSEQTGLSGSGLEFDLSAQIIKKGDWRWDASVNLATWKGEVKSVSADDVHGLSIGMGEAGIANVNIVGEVPRALYGFRGNGMVTDANVGSAPSFFGLAPGTGDVLYHAEGNDVGYGDRGVIGNPHPKIYGGFSTSVGFKRFSLDIALEGAAGHDILNLDRMMTENVSGTGNISRDAFLNARTAGATGTPSSPRFGAAGLGVISDRYVEKGDYLRLSDIRLSYDIPLGNVKWIESIGVWFNVHNAAVFTGYSGWDPEVSSFGTNNSRMGIAYGGYPGARSFTLGVSATF